MRPRPLGGAHRSLIRHLTGGLWRLFALAMAASSRRNARHHLRQAHQHMAADRLWTSRAEREARHGG